MDKNLILNRRAEIENELAALDNKAQALKAELGELAVAERVFDRLSGLVAVRAPVSAPAENDSQAPSTTPIQKNVNEPKLTVRQMVLAALRDAREKGLPGLAPKQIREFIKRNYGRDVGAQANTAPARMWRDTKEIEKDMEAGLFRLPKQIEAEGKNPSASISETPVQRHVAFAGGE